MDSRGPLPWASEEKKEGRMELIKLKNIPHSMRLFLSLMLCLVGLSYLTLLAGIWIDTEMKMVNIIEGYRTFEFIELVQHSFRYIFWFIGIFGITVSLFLLSSFPERGKKFVAVAVPLWIISDIGSMWLIRYSDFFAGQLYVSGVMLAAGFLAMFSFIQRDLWFSKVEVKVRERRPYPMQGLVSDEIQKFLDEVPEPDAVSARE